jgi:hypothetical protein
MRRAHAGLWQDVDCVENAACSMSALVSGATRVIDRTDVRLAEER